MSLPGPPQKHISNIDPFHDIRYSTEKYETVDSHVGITRGLIQTQSLLPDCFRGETIGPRLSEASSLKERENADSTPSD